MLSAFSQAIVRRSSQLLSTVGHSAAVLTQLQQRNVNIVRRLFPPPVPKLGKAPRVLKKQHRVYILEENTQHNPRRKLQLILTQDVPKYGLRGDVITVDKRIGRNKLLPSGVAVYASPENLKEFALAKQEEDDKAAPLRLTPMAVKTIAFLKKNQLPVKMHHELKWDVITKDHVIHAFRHNFGVVVPEHALTLPDEPITDFGTYNITVTVNGLETIPMEMNVVKHVPRTRRDREARKAEEEDG
ncbi:large ribosomal subunit protein bL9m-like isoform X2 [Diadema setosum]|uniref:large ribosomal subunit protein bL9m-like isoform X2 n=1 Tax=Diadema setosum TaxID=31175 RepID=UPI003B3A4719